MKRNVYRVEEQVPKDVVPQSGLLQVGQVEGVDVERLDEVVFEDELHSVGYVDVARPQVPEGVADEPDGAFVVVVARVVVGLLQVLDGQGEHVKSVTVGDDVDPSKPEFKKIKHLLNEIIE